MQYDLTTPDAQKSPFSRIPGWTIFRNREDDLHEIWLGLGKDVTAQLMHDLGLEMVAQSEADDLNEALAKQWLWYIAFWLDRGINVNPKSHAINKKIKTTIERCESGATPIGADFKADGVEFRFPVLILLGTLLGSNVHRGGEGLVSVHYRHAQGPL